MLSTGQASADDRSKSLQIWRKKCQIVEFHYSIRNHHEKCIQMSTNMPSIGSAIPEIISEMLEF